MNSELNKARNRSVSVGWAAKRQFPAWSKQNPRGMIRHEKLFPLTAVYVKPGEKYLSVDLIMRDQPEFP
jgi:hypothetical protein